MEACKRTPEEQEEADLAYPIQASMAIQASKESFVVPRISPVVLSMAIQASNESFVAPRISPVVLHTVANAINNAKLKFDHIIKITTKSENRPKTVAVAQFEIPALPTDGKIDEMVCRMKQLTAYFQSATQPMLDEALNIQAEAVTEMKRAYPMYDALASRATLAPTFDPASHPTWRIAPYYVKYATTRHRDNRDKQDTLPLCRSPCEWEGVFSSTPILEDYAEEAPEDERKEGLERRERRIQRAWKQAMAVQKAIDKMPRHATEAAWRAAIKDAELVAEAAASKFEKVSMQIRLATLAEVTARRDTLIALQDELDSLFLRRIHVDRKLRDLNHPYSETAHFVGDSVAMRLHSLQVDIDTFMETELKLKGRKVETTKAVFGARVQFIEEVMHEAQRKLELMEHAAAHPASPPAHPQTGFASACDVQIPEVDRNKGSHELLD